MTLGDSVRAFGVFLLNLVLALALPGVLDGPLVPFLHLRDQTRAAFLKADLLTATAAFVSGYFVYHFRRWAQSKWVWLVGVCWFVSGALFIVDNKHSTMFLELSRVRAGFDFLTVGNWLGFTIPLLTTGFYSVGAFCCCFFRDRKHSEYEPTSDVNAG
jgi:hypothetical protein